MSFLLAVLYYNLVPLYLLSVKCHERQKQRARKAAPPGLWMCHTPTSWEDEVWSRHLSHTVLPMKQSPYFQVLHHLHHVILTRCSDFGLGIYAVPLQCYSTQATQKSNPNHCRSASADRESNQRQYMEDVHIEKSQSNV